MRIWGVVGNGVRRHLRHAELVALVTKTWRLSQERGKATKSRWARMVCCSPHRALTDGPCMGYEPLTSDERAIVEGDQENIEGFIRKLEGAPALDGHTTR